jgi:MFS family permease
MAFGRYDYAAFNGFFAYSAASIIVPVTLVSLARDLNFSLESGGLAAGGALSVARASTMIIALVLCGFAAGHWGMRKTFGASFVFMGLGIASCAFAPTYGFLFLALMLSGFGEGIVDGLITPFVQELHPGDPGRYINFSHAFWSIGVLITVLVAGGLMAVGVSWRVLIGLVALLCMFVAVQLLYPESPGHEYPERSEPVHWKTTGRRTMVVLRRDVCRRWGRALPHILERELYSAQIHGLGMGGRDRHGLFLRRDGAGAHRVGLRHQATPIENPCRLFGAWRSSRHAPISVAT